MRSRTRIVITTTAIAMALSACSNSATESTSTADGGSYPVTVNSCGVDYTYDAPPERALLGAPGSIATLDALGVADSAVGYTNAGYEFDGIENFPRLTENSDDYTPSREFIIGTAPDLFLSNDELQLDRQGAASHEDLAAGGGNLYVLGELCIGEPAPTTVDAVYSDIENIGAIYGVPDRATEVVTQLRDRVAAARARNTNADSGEQLSAAVLQSSDGKVYAMSGGYYSAVLDALGMTNEFGDLGGLFTEITPEAAIAATPDVVLVGYNGSDADAAAAVADISAIISDSPAVQNNRVYPQDEADFQAGGVRIIDNIETTAGQVFAG